MARSDAVMSAAMRQPGLFSLVRRRHWPDADDVRVERHDQLTGPHLLPHAEIDLVLAHHPAQEQVEPLAGAAGRGAREEVRDARLRPLAAVDRRHVERQRARRERLQRLADVNGIARSVPRRRSLRSIRCDRSSGRRIQTSAAKSAPLVQRCTRCVNRSRSRAGVKPRTNAAGDGPITASMPSIEFSTLCTRPNASADGDERDHFPIVGPLVAVDHPDRIRNRLAGVEFRVECVEPGPKDETRFIPD